MLGYANPRGKAVVNHFQGDVTKFKLSQESRHTFRHTSLIAIEYSIPDDNHRLHNNKIPVSATIRQRMLEDCRHAFSCKV